VKIFNNKHTFIDSLVSQSIFVFRVFKNNDLTTDQSLSILGDKYEEDETGMYF
jgi:hypothetical protein